jgi:hypothetical protein
MIDRVEEYRKECIRKATPITREQYLKLNKWLDEIKLPCTAFWDHGEDISNPYDMIFRLSNDTFIIKDYFGESDND